MSHLQTSMEKCPPAAGERMAAADENSPEKENRSAPSAPQNEEAPNLFGAAEFRVVESNQPALASSR